MSENTKCTESVYRGDYRGGHSSACGRDAVEDGLCKLHLRVRENRRAKQRAWDEKQARGNALVAEAKALGAKLGIGVTADYNPYAPGGGGYTGRFVVDGDWLRGQV